MCFIREQYVKLAGSIDRSWMMARTCFMHRWILQIIGFKFRPDLGVRVARSFLNVIIKFTMKLYRNTLFYRKINV